MKIDRNNYELYFLDYLDGKLSDREILMLEDFLLLHPDLRRELEGTERTILFPEPVHFTDKDLLKKPDLTLPVSHENFDDYCVARAEGDLDEMQLQAMDAYMVGFPESAATLEFYKKLHLKADPHIIYTNKEKLRKSIVFIPRNVLYPVISVAAALAFIMVVYLRNESEKITSETLALGVSPVVKENPVKSLPGEPKSLEEAVSQKPVINEASLLRLSKTKQKKQTPAPKQNDTPAGKKEENKGRENLPPQRLNPSFQIKLPSLAENQLNTPAIEKEKVIKTVKTKSGSSSSEYLSLSEYARKQLSERVLGKTNPEGKNLSVWEIADAGINGINKLTGGKMKLERKTDQEGRITAYSFESKRFGVEKTASK